MLKHDEGVRKVMECANRYALSLGHNHIGTEHVLLSLVSEDEGHGGTILKNEGYTFGQLREILKKIIGPGDNVVRTALTMTPVLTKSFGAADKSASKRGKDVFDSFDLLAGILEQSDSVANKILRQAGFRKKKMYDYLDRLEYEPLKFHPPPYSLWTIPKEKKDIVDFVELLGHKTNIYADEEIDYWEVTGEKSGEIICDIPVPKTDQFDYGTPTIRYMPRNLGQVEEALDLRHLFVMSAQGYNETPLPTTVARRIRGRSKRADSLADRLTRKQ